MIIIDFFFHIDRYLNIIVEYCGVWSYAVLFLIIFAETGLVITPFLPGDSLLFVVGTFSAVDAFDITWASLILFAAAVIGDSVNYAIGKKIGEQVFKKDSRYFKKEYLDKTHAFYEKYGGKTIVLARFVPVIRTFAPFVAGAGRMSYGYFFSYNVIGAFLWVALFVGGGYFFGNTPFVKDNLSLVILVIVVVSVIPPAREFWKHYKANKRGKA